MDVSDPQDALKAKTVKENDVTATHLRKVMEDFLSRCGVPRGDVSYDEPLEQQIKIVTKITWGFHPKIRDVNAQAAKVKKALPENEMLEFTSKTTKELNSDPATVKEFIEKLRSLKLKDLIYLSRKLNILKARRAVGKVRCSVCQSSGKEKCPSCGGSGKITCYKCGGNRGVMCEVCHGSGKLNCEHCGGGGRSRCTACAGQGIRLVERTIGLEAAGHAGINFVAGESEDPQGKALPPLTKEDKTTILNSTVFELVSADYSPSGCQMVFEGLNRLSRLPFSLKDCPERFCYSVCGKEATPISKPHVLDFVYGQQEKDLDELVNTQKGHNVTDKLKCVRLIAGKAVLARTLRQMDEACNGVLRGVAERNGVPFADVMDEKKQKRDRRVAMVFSAARPAMLERIKIIIKNNSEDFISDEFAGKLAHDLLRFMPLLASINPDTRWIWRIVSFFCWFLIGMILFFFPSQMVAAFCFVGAVLVSICVSLFGTKNLVFFQAVSVMKVRRHGKSIPDLTPEAICTAKFLFVTALIETGVLLYKVSTLTDYVPL